MDFGAALTELKRGKRVTRRGWNGPAQYIQLQRTDRQSKMTLSYIYIRTVRSELVPWVASQTDILAEDWAVDIVGQVEPAAFTQYINGGIA